MILDVETTRDFYKYYGSRYLKGKDGHPYYCRQMSGTDVENNRVTVFRPKVKGDDWKQETLPFEEVDNRFLFGLYRLGTIAYDDELLYFSYYPTREGYRGFDTRRISAFSFNNQELSEQGATYFNLETFQGLVNPNAVRQLLFPIRLSFTEAIAKLTEGKGLAAALHNDHFGLYQSLYAESPFLTYKTQVVGKFEKDKIRLLTHIVAVGLQEAVEGMPVVLPDGSELK